MIKIRYAEIEDIEGMADVHLKTWKTTYSGIISEDFLSGLENKKDERINRSKSNFGKSHADGSKTHQVVAMGGEKVIGIATYGRYRGKETDLSNAGEIYSIYILKEYQGQGIGKKLINFAVRDLINEDYDSMVVWSLKDNPSVGFYKSIGGDERLTGTITIGGQVLDEIGFVYDDLHKLLETTDHKFNLKYMTDYSNPTTHESKYMDTKNRITRCSALILDMNKENLLLVQQRNKYGDLYWWLPGGALKENESMEEGLIRELSEELGIAMEFDYCFILEGILPKRYYEKYYTCIGRIDMKERFIANGNDKNEIVKYKWFNIRDKNNYDPELYSEDIFIFIKELEKYIQS